jgi:hypothetical protein
MLHRVGLDTQAEQVIATMTQIRLFAVSPDALELATFYDGTEDTLDLHIDLKKLPPL